jgi:hypothetical protein
MFFRVKKLDFLKYGFAKKLPKRLHRFYQDKSGNRINFKQRIIFRITTKYSYYLVFQKAEKYKGA